MPLAAYEIPQTGSFVAEPQYGGYSKGGPSGYTSAPYPSYHPHADHSMYGSGAPPYGQGHTSAPAPHAYHPHAEHSMYGSGASPYGQGHTSAPAPHAQSYQRYPMQSTASFTYERPIQQTYQMPTTASFTYEQPGQTYQMPTTASFTYEQPGQPWSYQERYTPTQSSYAMPQQQQSFAAYQQQAQYQSMADMPKFNFFAAAAPGVDRSSRPTGTMNHTPADPEPAKPTGPARHAPASPSMRPRSASPMPGRGKAPIAKPIASTSMRPPAKRAAKKKRGCCGVGCCGTKPNEP